MSEAEQTAAQPREGTVQANGITMYYREWGGEHTGNEPLLLLHGLASASRIWDLVAPHLATDRRVVALDQRGHGRSEKPHTGYDFATIVADDLAAANALKLGERFVVAGHSWGANVALEFAAAHPDRVTALALVDGGTSRGWSAESFEAVWERLAPPNFAGTPRETFLDWGRRSIPGYRPELDEIRLNIVELRADDTVGPRLARENHKQIVRAMYEEQPDQVYPKVRCPVLYLLAQPTQSGHGDDAFLVAKRLGIENAMRLLTSSPRVEVEWLADSVHDVPLQRPEEVAARIAAFLAGR